MTELLAGILIGCVALTPFFTTCALALILGAYHQRYLLPQLDSIRRVAGKRKLIIASLPKQEKEEKPIYPYLVEKTNNGKQEMPSEEKLAKIQRELEQGY